MRRRFVLGLFAFALFASACGEDDEDRVDAFVQAVTGEVSEDRVDHALRTYVDLDAEPLDLRAFGDSHVYRATQQSELEQRAHRALSRLHGDVLRVLRRRVDIKQDHAYVELQLLGRGNMGNVRYELRKHEKRWLISMLALQ